MDKLNRKKQELPNMNKFKQVKVGWMYRIDILREMVGACNLLREKKSNVFFKAYDVIK